MEELIDTKKSLAIENFIKVIKEEPDVLEDSTRMALLFIIMRQKEVTVEDLRDLLNIKGNTIYYHLKKLEDAGIIAVKKEPVPGTNLSRKICSTNPEFFEHKKDPTWEKIVKQNLKFAFLGEMYLAAAALMEAIRSYRSMSEGEFGRYFAEKKPQCDVLFLKKEQFLQLQSIITEFIQKTVKDDLSQFLDESEGYVYSIFAYPPREEIEN
ncbi:MAG: winged helix-turn-helix domain-containing protein [Promethearchaeota archaeon]